MKKLILSAAIGLCLGGVAMAGEAVDAKVDAGMDGQVEVSFDDLDRNRDGVLSRDEFDARTDLDLAGGVNDEALTAGLEGDAEMEAEAEAFNEHSNQDLDPALDEDPELAADIEADASADADAMAYDEDQTDDLVHTPDPDVFDSDWEQTNQEQGFDEDPELAADVDAEARMDSDVIVSNENTSDGVDPMLDEGQDMDAEIEADAGLEGDATAFNEDETDDLVHTPDPDVFDSDWELTNQDSSLDEDAVATAFESLDSDADGFLTESEAAEIDSLTPLYGEIDSDSDGTIAREEFVVMSDWEGDMDQAHTDLVTDIETHIAVEGDATAMDVSAEPELSADTRADLDTDLDIDTEDSDTR